MFRSGMWKVGARVASAGLGRWTIMAALLVAVLWSDQAFAVDGAVDLEDMDITTTRDLLDLCSARPTEELGLEARYLCLGFVAGAVNYHQAITTPLMEPIACAPEDATREQFINAVVSWGELNQAFPDLMNALAVEGLVRVAKETWPCP